MDPLPEFPLAVAGVRWRCLGLSQSDFLIELAESFALLLEGAREARERAYAPYSGFRVGAAVRMDGRIFTGANVENASYGATLCAERTAISAAVAAGHRSLGIVAISTDAADQADLGGRAPCGLCRQVISEFSAPGLLVLLDGGRGADGLSKGEAVPFELLLPWRFRFAK
jgi:cytidine deaminase